MKWHLCLYRRSLPSLDVIELHCEDCDRDSKRHTCNNNTNAHKTAGFHARHCCAGQGDVNNCLDRGLKYNPFIWTLFSSLGHAHMLVRHQHTLLLPSVAEGRAESVTFLCLQLFSLAHAWFSVPADGWKITEDDGAMQPLTPLDGGYMNVWRRVLFRLRTMREAASFCRNCQCLVVQ